MSRLAKTTILTLLVTTVAATGCRPNRGTASPQDYFGLIQVAFQGGEIASMIGRNEAIKAKNFAGCVSSDVLLAAFDSAGDALNAKVMDNVVIPGFDLDLSECMAFREVPAEEAPPEETAPAEEAPEADGDNASLPASVVIAMVAPAPAEEAPAEEAPAEEPAAEEPAAEEPAAEEPETPSVEEVAAGNENAAALVESIAGVAIIAGAHYATKLKATDCKKGELALGVLGYLSGMVKPIADEIAEPDGKISIPAVTLDLSACSEG